MSLNPTKPEPPIVLSPWLYGQSNVAFFANLNPTGVWPNVYLTNMINETGLGSRCTADGFQKYDIWNINFCEIQLSIKLFFSSLPCYINKTGLLNPTVNPDDYQDFRCPCNLGIATCPANVSSVELPKYRSVSTDDFYDLTGKDISLWIVRSHREFKKSRYYTLIFNIFESIEF